MKNRLLSDEKIKQYTQALTESVYTAKRDNGDTFTWNLFYDELFESESNNGVYDTGAISLAISALCNSELKTGAYKDIIDKARLLLIRLRNDDGSWSALADESDVANIGIIYNTVNALEAIIDSGYLEMDYARDKIVENIQLVYESLKWIYLQKIQNESNIGWGYSGDVSNKIYIMPTANVLLIMKKFYYCVATSMPSMLEELVIEGKCIHQIINEIHESIYNFRTSPDGGWGKDIEERNDRIVYTMYGLYSLSYAKKGQGEVLDRIKKLSKEDVDYFSKLICSWNSKKVFEIRRIDLLMPEEYFDSYIQSTPEDGKINNAIIDHESFFEAIAINSIIEFVRVHKKDIPKTRQAKFFEIISKLSKSLMNRVCDVSINDKNYTVVRSRRGLLSQSYPIYAITQATDALVTMRSNKKEIISLLKYKELFIKVVGVLIQIASLCMINRVAIPNISWPTLLCVSAIAPLSEYLKNWIFKMSKIEE